MNGTFMFPAVATSRTRVTVPQSLLRAMILFGIIFAFEAGILTTVNRFQTHRNCTGAFSTGFSSGFDRYRCELTIRYVGTPLEITIPAPN
jgi:hypothetical protein